ncbi:hypothetical protein Bca4012_067484 [Brassica carinata]
MARRKPNASPKKATRQPAAKQKFSSAERSSLYASREAAKVLGTVLRGDAERRAVASIKSLVLRPSVRNKRGTFALVCETLKHLTVIKDVLEIADVLNSKWKRQEPLVYIICYDILFGKEPPLIGDAEKFLMKRKDALVSSLATLLVRKKVETVDELLGLSQLNGAGPLKPRYVRVNTLKMDVDSAVQELGKLYKVQKDETVPDLLVMPPGSDLHAHHLVKNGRIFLQGKGSAMVAAALQPEPGWEVRAILLDPSCSGSGTITDRLDHLLPSHSAVNENYDSIRLHKLAVFQKKALAHALSFPHVESVVYSTCSIHQIENEDVVSSVLPLASSLGFELATPFPQWQRRGLPVFEGSEHLLRMDPDEDKEGFFIALFTKTNKLDDDLESSDELPERVCRRRRKQCHPFLWPKVFFRAWNGRMR